MKEVFSFCPVCGTNFPHAANDDRGFVSFHCLVCGKYQLSSAHLQDFGHFNMNHLAAFLAHNAYNPTNDADSRYHTTASKEICEELRQEGRGHPVHIDSEMVETWYPKSFAEKIDYILLYIFEHAPHLGQTVPFSAQQLYSILFIDRYEVSSGELMPRPEEAIRKERNFMLDCLTEMGYIQNHPERNYPIASSITLKPPAYARIDEIQKIQQMVKMSLWR